MTQEQLNAQFDRAKRLASGASGQLRTTYLLEMQMLSAASHGEIMRFVIDGSKGTGGSWPDPIGDSGDPDKPHSGDIMQPKPMTREEYVTRIARCVERGGRQMALDFFKFRGWKSALAGPFWLRRKAVSDLEAAVGDGDGHEHA